MSGWHNRIATKLLNQWCADFSSYCSHFSFWFKLLKSLYGNSGLEGKFDIFGNNST